jgi:peroxiredoxin
MRTYLSLFCILIALLLAPDYAGAVEVGKPAPGFTLQDLAGKNVSLADFKGRVVVLKLATTWCPSCKVLSRELASLGDFFKERNVVLLEVFVQDTAELLARYFTGQSFPMTHHALLDEDMQAYKRYNVYLIPRLLVIDREQKVRFDNGNTASVIPAAEIRKLVEAAL